MKKQNQFLNLIKFLFSLVIILYHANVLFFGGYVVVEGFFMISGYLMMCSIARTKEGEELSAPAFVWKKYKSVFLVLLFSALISLAVYVKIYSTDDIYALLRALPLALFEVVPLQVAGFDGLWLTGVSWYLSAMLLASLAIYPLACRFRKRFASVICPVMSVMIWGILCSKFHTLNVPDSWILSILNTGLLRGVAGLAAGCALWALLDRMGDRELTNREKLCNTLFEVAGYALVAYIMIRHSSASLDFVALPVLFLLLFIGIGGRSYLSAPISKLKLGSLGTASTVVYLNHHYWNVYLNKFFPGYYTTGQFLLRYFALIILSSAAVFGLKLLVEKAWAKKH